MKTLNILAAIVALVAGATEVMTSDWVGAALYALLACVSLLSAFDKK